MDETSGGVYSDDFKTRLTFPKKKKEREKNRQVVGQYDPPNYN